MSLELRGEGMDRTELRKGPSEAGLHWASWETKTSGGLQVTGHSAPTAFTQPLTMGRTGTESPDVSRFLGRCTWPFSLPLSLALRVSEQSLAHVCLFLAS